MKPGTASGFTLLEILAALAVFGLLLMALHQTIGFGVNAWHRDNQMSAGKIDLESADRTLRLLVEGLARGDESARTSITGTPASLSGVTRMTLPGAASPVRVEVGLGVSGKRLVMRWRPYHHATPLNLPPAPAETPLLNGVERLSISYWRAPGVWVSDWHDPTLPLLIRFHITFRNQTGQAWPDIVAAPLITRP